MGTPKLAPRRSREVDHTTAISQLHEALDQLDKRLVQVVECRFLGGMTEQETADALGIERTLRRDWVNASGLLSQALRADSLRVAAQPAGIRGHR